MEAARAYREDAGGPKSGKAGKRGEFREGGRRNAHGAKLHSIS